MYKNVHLPNSQRFPRFRAKQLALSNFFRRWHRRKPTRCVRNSRDLSTLRCFAFLSASASGTCQIAICMREKFEWPLTRKGGATPRWQKGFLVPNGAFGCLNTFLVKQIGMKKKECKAPKENYQWMFLLVVFQRDELGHHFKAWICLRSSLRIVPW